MPFYHGHASQLPFGQLAAHYYTLIVFTACFTFLPCWSLAPCLGLCCVFAFDRFLSRAVGLLLLPFLPLFMLTLESQFAIFVVALFASRAHPGPLIVGFNNARPETCPDKIKNLRQLPPSWVSRLHLTPSLVCFTVSVCFLDLAKHSNV